MGRAAPLLLFACAVALVAACRDDGVRPTTTVTAADSADQILEGMEYLITNDGVRRTRVEADTAYVYEATQLARLMHVKVTFYNANGLETSAVTADSGHYQMRDGSMDAWGHVVGTTPDGKRLKTEQLKYDAQKHQVSSTEPFTFDKPQQHMSGNGFTSDPDFANVTAGQPKGRELPGQGGGGFLLPGQQ
jgi:LPS export ABC transporter protein LptC